MSLYTRLFKYSKREKENFLTEAFCDLLNFLTKDKANTQQKLLHSLFAYEGKQSVQFATQYRPKGESIIPDLVGTVHGSIVLVVEVKIAAEFTPNQLKRYGDWLTRTGTPASLVLLTDKRDAPDDFEGRVVRWQTVYQELQFLDCGISVKKQVNDFSSFLRQENLGVDMPTKTDFERLENYIAESTPNRIQQFMDDVRNSLLGVTEPYKNIFLWGKDSQTQAGGMFYGNAPNLGSWVHLQHTEAQLIAWGLYFPPKEDSDEPDPFGFHTYFDIERCPGLWLNVYFDEPEKAKLHLGKTGLKKDWRQPVSREVSVNAPAVAFCPLQTAGNAGAMKKWFEDIFRDALQVYLGLGVEKNDNN